MPIPVSLRAELGISAEAPAAGGCIHDCYRVSIGGTARFLKANAMQHEDAFAAEADGLQALRSVGLRAPAALKHGTAAGLAYLLLEHLDLESTGDFAALGRMLASAHRKAGPRFGWHRDNYIGATPQANRWKDNWAQFWLERRLRPQLDLARTKGFDLEAPSLGLLDGHDPQPSLLHGDLWRGNAGFTPQGPVVFDPAVYYGDREADLAMTELFGGFPPEFYEGYNSEWPLDGGYSRRKPLYNLYHLLNHLNLFGGGYLGQVKETLRLLLLG
ncbi:MAG TPA: fructosamine kinase family protein [Burkholderiales bacterium]